MPLRWPSVRQDAAAHVRDVRAAIRDSNSTSLVPRVAAGAFLLSGLLILVVEHLAPALPGGSTMTAVALAATVFGMVALVLPWQRWKPSVQLVIPGFAFVLFACGGAAAGGSLGPYFAMLPLPFVLIGFSQPPGSSAAMAPAAALSIVIAGRFDLDPALLGALVFALPLSVLVGETLALAQARRTRAEQRVERLLEAVRVLARMKDTRTGAQIVAALTAELLGADAVTVLLADRAGSRRYLNRAFFGHPALADAAPLLIDALDRSDAMRAGTTQFIVDPARVHRLANSASCVRALAVVPLPGTSATPIGVVIAMWTTGRRRLAPSARQAAELLSEEAGRMFQRLSDAAALTRDAETDPLTELANRRTFNRSLATLRPGDAVVIVDVDFFKAVNDRFGHDKGDETLRMLARCLRDTARQVDCVARYGGEEFAVILPEAGVVGATAMLHRLRRVWEAHDAVTTFSAGVAVHVDGCLPRETLRRADAALYAAKEGGRDRDVIATGPDLDLMLP